MTETIPFNIPMIDISRETRRHVIVPQGTAESYKVHPTTLLMPDGKTIYCVYLLGHGGPSAVLCRSDDGWMSWTDPLPVPENWITASNCPALYRFVGSDNIERLFIFEGLPTTENFKSDSTYLAKIKPEILVTVNFATENGETITPQ
jgi:hypothetical protein